MNVSARAPGKVVVLGEYAVLKGAPALVLAVDRYCRAEISENLEALCHLRSWAPKLQEFRFDPLAESGLSLVDTVINDSRLEYPWRGDLDSRALYGELGKLGIGSSAAALTAWAGVWCTFAGLGGIDKNNEGLGKLINWHRSLQGGLGSGLDVAASLFGSMISFELQEDSAPVVDSVQLPSGVTFAGVCVGRSASTKDFLKRFNVWQDAFPAQASEQLSELTCLAKAGHAAAAENDSAAFLSVLTEYGECLGELGEAMGVDIVTRAHREIGNEAKRYSVSYKISGAGGGDLGLAFSADTGALKAFLRKMENSQYKIINFGLDRRGLCIDGHI